MKRILTARTVAGVVATLCLQTAQADNRLFTYTYEPETMPQGGKEFEQWVTLQSGRTKNVGQENYHRWDLREEFEYGVVDWYTASVYLNFSSESYKEPAGGTFSEFSFKGVSLENKFEVLNSAVYPVGLSLYLEPTF